MTRNDKASEALEAYFKKWQEMGERMRAIVAPVLKQQEQLQKYLQPIVELQQTFQKALEPILAEQERWETIVRSIELPKIALPDLAPRAR